MAKEQSSGSRLGEGDLVATLIDTLTAASADRGLKLLYGSVG